MTDLSIIAASTARTVEGRREKPKAQTISKDFSGLRVVWVMNCPICPTGKQAHKRIVKRLAGMSLTELVCVIAIIAILGSLYLGAVIRAFTRVVKFLKGMSD